MTLAITVTGCLLIGVLMTVLGRAERPHPLVRPLLGVGVLGGYTTFSGYAVDAQRLFATGHPGRRWRPCSPRRPSRSRRCGSAPGSPGDPVAGRARSRYRCSAALPRRPGRTAAVGTGFCGALSTYSTFGWETLHLPHRRAVGYVLVSTGAALGAAALGWALGTGH